jgi:hypothetical protein
MDLDEVKWVGLVCLRIRANGELLSVSVNDDVNIEFAPTQERLYESYWF